MLDFLFKPPAPVPPTKSDETHLVVHGRPIPLHIVRNDRARRYLLRVRSDGAARLTIPRRGSLAEGRRFAERQIGWLAQQLEKLAKQPVRSQDWRLGAEIYFRGAPVSLTQHGEAIAIQFADQLVRVPDSAADLRPAITRHLWRLAAAELPPRTLELAASHSVTVTRVSVRNQRSRWGSCSRRGTISLNWRLIQTPAFVRDYIILHELMHRRQMNHSPRFWREVESVCPDYPAAETWLRTHSHLLR
jgi:predicted metal-dependent hydrolase